MGKLNENIQSWCNLGVCFAKQGKHSEAMDCYEHVLEINPHHVKTLSNRGSSLCYLEKFQEGIENFALALEIEPNDSTILKNLSLAFSLKQE